MSRVVNAIVVGIAAFTLLAGLAWLLLVAPEPAGSGGELEEETTTTETTSESTSPSETRTTTTGTTTTKPAPTTSSPPQTTTYQPQTTPPQTQTTTYQPNNNTTLAMGVGGARILQQDVRLDVVWIEDAALRFILGGIILMALVFVVLLIQGVFPRRRHDGAPFAKATRVMLHTPTVETVPTAGPARFSKDELTPGRRLSRRVRPKTLDEAMDAYDEAYGGQPRLMRVVEDRIVIRLYRCDECRGPTPSEGCPKAAGYFGEAVERVFESPAKVVETLCQARGAPVCEFEVRA